MVRPQGEEGPRPGDRPEPAGWWRGLSGTLAAGMVVLAIGVLGAQILTLGTGAPGPGALAVSAHLVAAALALAAQWLVDHRRGRVAGLSALGVVAVAGGTLWLFWWQ